ncbi:Uncharacterised protein [Staphylococcus aureus]|uniref:Uncharacterized protein n=1 Tax=Staphylococcus aureus TaxID=1280 RepID=A0A380DUW7_STAAU|nr:hypothetical protein CGP83_01866 [Staphylococcus aureus]VTS24108.1 Uncharacterised protein [Staphylococcus hyicus]AXJ26162.1 hypothetical protein CGP84_01867 [Staphylococcus aureus]AXJ46602.1 hypothetical protein CGP93_01876 [Staphylococcus aureus]AXJ49165.1 hypothetical protein CGP94_01874 [Staphylococcus aureus]
MLSQTHDYIHRLLNKVVMDKYKYVRLLLTS